jgi:aldose 1-epimerase
MSLFTLVSPSGLVAMISELGATLVELQVPDGRGRRVDVVLGFDRLERYLEDGHYFGCVVGRVANRIAGARFTLDGREHALSLNHGRHHLHGGTGGFSRAIWRAEVHAWSAEPALLFRYRSADGEDGYPGALDASVVYTLTLDGGLRVDFTATADRTTIVNLSQHTYWNLAGHDSGSVLDHQLEIAAQRYTPADAELIPTGAIAPVAGGPFDFTSERRVASGYDVNFVLDGPAGTLRRVATLRAPDGARTMEVWTTEPGLQLYTGDNLSNVTGKRGAIYGKNAGLCLETQHFPDSIHHQGENGWPSIVLRPGETYRHVVLYRFDVA